jgi:DNA repair protein RadC
LGCAFLAVFRSLVFAGLNGLPSWLGSVIVFAFAEYTMSHRIHDMPEEDRPRERLLRLGAEALSDAELVAIFIHTGVKGQSALQIASRLLQDHGGVRNCSRVIPADLSKSHGLGPAKAAVLAAAFELGKRAAREEAKLTPLDIPERIYA